MDFSNTPRLTKKNLIHNINNEKKYFKNYNSLIEQIHKVDSNITYYTIIPPILYVMKLNIETCLRCLVLWQNYKEDRITSYLNFDTRDPSYFLRILSKFENIDQLISNFLNSRDLALLANLNEDELSQISFHNVIRHPMCNHRLIQEKNIVRLNEVTETYGTKFEKISNNIEIKEKVKLIESYFKNPYIGYIFYNQGVNLFNNELIHANLPPLYGTKVFHQKPDLLYSHHKQNNDQESGKYLLYSTSFGVHNHEQSSILVAYMESLERYLFYTSPTKDETFLPKEKFTNDLLVTEEDYNVSLSGDSREYIHSEYVIPVKKLSFDTNQNVEERDRSYTDIYHIYPHFSEFPIETQSKNGFAGKILNATTNGYAVHFNPTLAVKSALYELFERDNIMYTWLSGNYPNPINQNLVFDPSDDIIQWIDTLEDHGITSHFFSHSRFDGIHTIECLLLGDFSYLIPYSIGSASNTDIKISFHKAFYEAMLGILLEEIHFRKKPKIFNQFLLQAKEQIEIGPIQDFRYRTVYYYDENNIEELLNSYYRINDTVDPSKTIEFNKENPSENKVLQEVIKNYNIGVYSYQFPHLENYGIHGYRVISPDLIPLILYDYKISELYDIISGQSLKSERELSYHPYV